MPSPLSLSDFIRVKPFLIAFSLTMLYVYCFTERPEIIIKYPTPENAHQFIFKDDSDNCYRFHTQEVKCPVNPLEVSSLPVQRRVETFKGNLSMDDIKRHVESPYNLDSNEEERGN
jgi:hypothetical protein